MSDGIRWIGEHSGQSPDTRIPGMLGGISLTAARDIDAEDFLTLLGAEPLQLDAGHLFKDRRSVTLPDGVDPRGVKYAMYGTCKDWVYVLEDWGMATWHLHRYGGPLTPVLAEVETVCLSNNSDAPPPRIALTTSEGRIVGAEFGEDTGCGSALDEALQRAGAVFPSVRDLPQDEVELYWERHIEELPAAVFSAVEAYCGLSVDRAAVEAGDLPVAVLFPLA
ncbi:hypothetical protein [Nocardiopsis tropica]|uniref:SUKH-4 immunity protein of toxin-antitoxin system n=1 Tax=Nocardiopsis tropica TaxID=109330 RepID=A0ABU7KMC3_9ACTN|nr:hypothetical protein [Nocardiopsis umidischolae]MEE2050440.1 hypothetical protein [Nocardiopsis umidischolae]